MQCLNHLGVCVLLQPTLCNADTSCDAAAVRMAVADPSRFTIKLQTQPDATTCVNYIDNGGVPPPPPPAVPAGMSDGGGPPGCPHADRRHPLPIWFKAAPRNQRSKPLKRGSYMRPICLLYSREGFPCASAGPCFAVTVVLNGTAASGHAFALAATITEDRYTTVTPLSATEPGVQLCL